MAKALEAWLKETGATFPAANPKFDAAAAAKEMPGAQEKAMPAREREHAAFLDPGFEPKGGWWDLKK